MNEKTLNRSHFFPPVKVNPALQKNGLPQYALPDLAQFGRCWVSAVTKLRNRLQYQGPDQNPTVLRNSPPSSSVLGSGEVINTSCGRVRRSMLQPSYSLYRSTYDGHYPPTPSSSSSEASSEDLRMPTPKKLILATEVGSRIGVVYCPDPTGYFARMHFIINGEDQGPSDEVIPLTPDSTPLYAVVDVYGTTKQVRLVQLYKGQYYKLKGIIIIYYLFMMRLTSNYRGEFSCNCIIN